ncbi:hypothetical protein [Microbacterium sp. 5K110]|jgi:hypothetical protein|uniref:hypothetical protein n=1 Tax=Microbacterium sp. 5K110 TaxID=2578104 RepID=UPI0010FF1408|nr:hypothetical protein [Microbacterium sp. 5K110]TLF33235.1 hypothetical protein FE256_03830 [Microbacterium sp. 5K110]
MAKIRDDLEGIALTETGLILRAGDKIPKGVKVGDHLLAEKNADDVYADEGKEDGAGSDTGSSGASEPSLPPRGGAGSGAGAWRAYGVAAAKAKGLEIDIPADATKTDIIEALKSVDIPVE